MNLPIEIRFLIQNVFVFGMMPIGQADVWTISHLLDSFVTKMHEFKPPGKLFRTYRHPEGVLVQNRVVPLIADLGAIRKIAGYLSHGAIQNCTVCLLKADDIDNLDYRSWTYRDGATVKIQGEIWHNLTTLSAKIQQAKETGVRWSPVHELYLWDPVKYILLGFMHNSLEGKAEFHLRALWGIGRQAQTAKDLVEEGKEDEFSEGTQQNSSEMDEDENFEAEGSTTPTPGDVSKDLYMGNEDEDRDDDDDYFPPVNGTGVFDFTEDELTQIQACITEVHLPTWVGRPPTNLGEASHGKLKAQELLILFTVIFPLIIPELWWNAGEESNRLLDNFYHLVACLNIISSYSTTNNEADAYMDHYVLYRKSMNQLFTRFSAVPNHHYAMHNGELLKFWGPLAGLSEFPGEHLNGEFSKVKTNRRSYDMDLTMLRQIAHRGRLEAILKDNLSSKSLVGELSHILQPGENTNPLEPLTGLETAKILGSGKELSIPIYTMILEYLHSAGQSQWRSYSQMPHLAAELVLPRSGKMPSDFKLDGHTFSCKKSHEGNSGIQFKNPDDPATLLTGYIDEIWQIPLQGSIQTFLVVEKHLKIPQFVTVNSPFISKPRFATSIVDASPSNDFCIIEPHHILTHLTIFKRPKKTYGIEHRNVLVVCWSLNRGRRS
ncbi:hypothetical protein C8R43DRAFT_869275 [Mycena crocata]|nr:hypothetical protein C8R43DRAFT_869275 [Mycena crocata]